MRSLYLITAVIIAIIVLGNSFAKESAGQLVTNNPATFVDTNLAACVLTIEPRRWNGDPPPTCIVRLDNFATNTSIQGLRLPAEKLFVIGLIDAQGQPVTKTEYGRQFGQPLTQKQLNDWAIPKRVAGRTIWFRVPPETQVGVFSIPKAFQLTQPGEYMLHVRMRLIQSSFSDPSGIVGQTNIFGGQYMGPGRTTPTVFQLVWLPETTVKVQIRPEDLKP